jgi:hypothetical protein
MNIGMIYSGGTMVLELWTRRESIASGVSGVAMMF